MKIFLTIILLAVGIISFTYALDEGALSLQNEAFQRAMVSFGLAKGLNGVISLLQGTEVSFTPVGVGVNFSVGEVLDPFNDMVERFSWIMLLSSVSLGIQKLLLVFSSKIFLQVVFGVSIVSSLVLLWFEKLHKQNLIRFSLKLFLFLFLLRFAAVLFTYSSEFLYNSLLVDEYKSSSLIVEQTKEELQNFQHKNIDAVEAPKNKGVLSSLGSKYDSVIESLNISKQFASLEKSVNEASNKIINLITIFILQTILMPLLFLWLFVHAIRFIFGFKYEYRV